ncbi:MAG: hypothetical protein H6701_17345 [Myxococcales bacterium]|nr:hypothetical protein [Myxococcales bacterium]
MTRLLSGLALGAVTFAATAAPAAKTAAQAPLAPVNVTLENTCDAPLAVELGTSKFDIAAGQSTDPQAMQGRETQAFELKLGGHDAGLLGMAPGGTYHVRFMNCRDGAADILTEDKSERPAAISPQAAAQVRFRALNAGKVIEYKPGKTGRFKFLSVGYTSYEEQPGGEFDFTVRLRADKRGPVMGMARKQVALAPGHRYLIETNVVGNDILYKFEDEGWDVPRK